MTLEWIATTTTKSLDFEFWNFVIAFLALALALYGIWLTKSLNRFKIEIDDCTYSKKIGEPALLSFQLHNVSSVSTKVIKIEFSTYDDTPIVPIIGYEPNVRYHEMGFGVRYPDIQMPFEQELVLSSPQVLLSNSSTSFRYFMNPPSAKVKIKVTCDRRVYFIKKYKYFSVEFHKLK